MPFSLHPQLAKDTLPVTDLALSSVRLMRDGRFLWLVLVPKRPNVSEIFELNEVDQALLTKEISITSRLLKSYAQCDKINIASFGNMVPQLHIHIIARFTADPAWPGSVFGSGEAMPRDSEIEAALVADLRKAFGN